MRKAILWTLWIAVAPFLVLPFIVAAALGGGVVAAFIQGVPAMLTSVGICVAVALMCWFGLREMRGPKGKPSTWRTPPV